MSNLPVDLVSLSLSLYIAVFVVKLIIYGYRRLQFTENVVLDNEVKRRKLIPNVKPTTYSNSLPPPLPLKPSIPHHRQIRKRETSFLSFIMHMDQVLLSKISTTLCLEYVAVDNSPWNGFYDLTFLLSDWEFNDLITGLGSRDWNNCVAYSDEVECLL